MAADTYIVSRIGGDSDLQIAGKYSRHRASFLAGGILFLLLVTPRAR